MGQSSLGPQATAGLCQPLIGMMLPRDVYLESHLGGAAIGDCSCDDPVERVHGGCHEFLKGYPFGGGSGWLPIRRTSGAPTRLRSGTGPS